MRITNEILGAKKIRLQQLFHNFGMQQKSINLSPKFFLDIDKSLATYSLPATCNVFPVAIPGILAQMQGSWSQRDSIPNNGCDGNQGGSSLEQDFLALFP